MRNQLRCFILKIDKSFSGESLERAHPCVRLAVLDSYRTGWAGLRIVGIPAGSLGPSNSPATRRDFRLDHFSAARSEFIDDLLGRLTGSLRRKSKRQRRRPIVCTSQCCSFFKSELRFPTVK